MKDVIEYFREKLRKKKKKTLDEWSDHPVHEKYVKQRPVKK